MFCKGGGESSIQKTSVNATLTLEVGYVDSI